MVPCSQAVLESNCVAKDDLRLLNSSGRVGRYFTRKMLIPALLAEGSLENFVHPSGCFLSLCQEHKVDRTEELEKIFLIAYQQRVMGPVFCLLLVAEVTPYCRKLPASLAAKTWPGVQL